MLFWFLGGIMNFNKIKDWLWSHLYTITAVCAFISNLVFIQFVDFESSARYWFITIASIGMIAFVIWQDIYFGKKSKQFGLRMKNLSLTIKLLDDLILYYTNIKAYHERCQGVIDFASSHSTSFETQDMRKISSLQSDLSEWNKREKRRLKELEEMVKSDPFMAQQYNHPPNYTIAEDICTEMESIVGIDDTLDSKIIH